MITQRRSARSKLVARPSILAERRSIASDRLGRLIQIALAALSHAGPSSCASGERFIDGDYERC